MSRHVVFFVFDPSPRIDRRIREFIGEGYEVEVYGLANEKNIRYCRNDVYIYQLIAEMRPGMPYLERASHLKKILQVIDRQRNDTLFYFFTLNVAIVTLLRRNIRFIYEESDMLFDRFNNRFLQKLVIAINKRIIKRSLQTVFTSEGFADYYYGDIVPNNVSFITNRVSSECLKLDYKPSSPPDFEHLKFAFVGNIRYQSILNVSSYISDCTQHEFHYYGNAESLSKVQLSKLDMPRVHMHGLFSNPGDLPSIYSSIDFVVCTYDINGVNPRYAEPNKLYEAIFFRKPIIVSCNSFLAKKVERLGIGLSLDPNSSDDINSVLSTITPESYNRMIKNLNGIPQLSAVNINDGFFKKLEDLLS